MKRVEPGGTTADYAGQLYVRRSAVSTMFVMFTRLTGLASTEKACGSLRLLDQHVVQIGRDQNAGQDAP